VLGRTYDDQNCSIARALELVGERWTMLVLREAFTGRRRFDEMAEDLGIARNVLTARLGHLVDEGASVVVTDVSPAALDRVRSEHPDVRVVATADELVALPLDVYAPCAMGGALTDDVVDVLTARIVCGAANNQLAHPGIEKALEERGILYAPDYCVNSGGLIQVADELDPAGFSFDRAKQRAAGIYDTTYSVFELAAQDGVPPAIAADRLAERRMRDVGRLRGIWLG